MHGRARPTLDREAGDLRLLIVIADEDDADGLIRRFVDLGLGVTRVAGTGGFLRRGNAPLLAAIADDAVEKAIEVVRQQCRKREVLVDATFDVKATVGGAAIFVLEVEQSVKV